MNYQTLTDEELVTGLCNSKIAAFDEIYRRYWKILYVVAYNQLGAKEEAEDIIHNVFVRIWNNRENQKINCLKAYLIVSVRHLSINYIKSQITYRKFQEYLIFQEIQKNFSTEEIVNYTELQRVVNEVLGKLPDKTVEVFKLSRFGNKTTKEIAAHLELTEKAVEYHITKSLKFLKERLDIYYSQN